jgi:plasmid maintenance system antidote protein VapI
LTVAQKIRAFLKDRAMSQADLSKVSLVATSNLSELISGKQDITLTMAIRLSRVMECLIDDLINDELDYPLPKRDTKQRPLTAPERKVIELAHEASRRDPRPADLETARDLLMGRMPLGPVYGSPPLLPGATPPAPPQPPSEGQDGGKRRR